MKSIFFFLLFVCIIGCAAFNQDSYIDKTNADLETAISNGLKLYGTERELYNRAFDFFSETHHIIHYNDWVGKHVSPPKLIRYNKPIYPYACYLERSEGEVVAAILIGEEGKVLEATILNPAHRKFNLYTLIYVRTWEFSPGEIDGRPELFIYLIPVKFVLQSKG